ncbi:uncharacterized protein LOC130426861 isoform X1 [Triplophysa dalaica]|uniref:uncharacterized protein LOC130426861 isoform X1 n=1 Tax=Triplophysa dalaica TaxID=1582913 RepID=UPI0024DF92D7|nr:uncharacterized protein LOC130426861 isoform X1 [Triplophysa dalaica]XP_056609802.1 uncharacterized protein LOC130426861 isoform X1 [Triplophysa dalaica]
MNLSNSLLMSILLRIAYGFTVKGPSGPLVVPLGGSVLLPCSVDSLSSLKDLEVEWKRSDSQTLIHLYQDGDIRPEVQNEDYHDRAHFFTDDIKQGNFTLLLKNVTAEDEGQYTCTVHSGQESGETVMEIKDVERLIVSGSNKSLSVYVGEDVTLNCSVDSHIPAEEVSWKKRVKDEHITVLLYQNKETQPEASDAQYRDRVEFFNDEIHRGNFSLRLKKVRTEDKGLYMCQVFAGRFSDNTTVTLGQLGFSSLHIMVLILCISACGSALLFCSLIYCRSKHKDAVIHLQMLLILCPNIIMFFAFVFWGVSDGFLNETVTCCALFFLRPLMLLWTVPKANELSGITGHWVRYGFRLEYIIFTIVVFSVLYKNVINRLLHYSVFERGMITTLFAIVPIMCGLIIIYIFTAMIPRLTLNIMAFISFDILPPLQLILLFYAFGIAKGTFLIAGVLPVIVIVARFDWSYICGKEGLRCSRVVMGTGWIIFTLLMNVILALLYIMALENEIDRAGWICLIVFLQVLWTFNNFRRSFNHWDTRSNSIVFVFGSVGVVLINAVALMTELILKTVNGERSLTDLRITVFSSESLTVICLLFLQLFDTSEESDRSKKLRRQSSFTQNYYNRHTCHQNHNTQQNPTEEHETLSV